MAKKEIKVRLAFSSLSIITIYQDTVASYGWDKWLKRVEKYYFTFGYLCLSITYDRQVGRISQDRIYLRSNIIYINNTHQRTSSTLLDQAT